eukprot:13028612-Heterocapsa_arctica.AAC.1
MRTAHAHAGAKTSKLLKELGSLTKTKLNFRNKLLLDMTSRNVLTKMIMTHQPMRKDILAMFTVAISVQATAELRRRSSP